MADGGPHVPAPKVSRPSKKKTAHQTKTMEPPQKDPPKQNTHEGLSLHWNQKW